MFIRNVVNIKGKKKKVSLVLFFATVLLLSTNICFAESVLVKYKGVTSLQGYSCTATQSSFVHRICYLKSEKYLVVLLGDTYYHYCSVPEVVHSSWLSASSKGSYYGRAIKGNYDCRVHGVPTGL